MSCDHYKVLNIARSASQDEIKKAYRILALKNHPDKGGDEEVFKKISVAYECLSNIESKNLYDNPQQEINFGHGHSHEDLFEQFFGRQQQQQQYQQQHQPIKRQSHIYKIKVALKDIHIGIQKTLRITIKKTCFECKKTCNNCNGTGNMTRVVQMGPFMQQIQTVCSNCTDGSINKQDINCLYCNGTNIKEQEESIKIDIPKNCKNGMLITFKALGEQCKKENEIAGDFIVEINIDSDQYFMRENNDLIYKSKITLMETLTGKDLIIPHFDENINLNTSELFGIINPNQRYYVKEKGLGSVGDLIILFEVIYPENKNKLSIEEKNILLQAFTDLSLS